ncbi:hypothetical protein PISMIDRAFT_684611 [Pisolithus microcarpus 441]|uniref:Uncharacterized protein n=1 Tax=Pisolithus microcarpus 441 TaxID=765257 RepID=A0A0C9YMV9_9AGAM|nr:hypothetical protein PISMIDRAFT_684611 [Pisolithus microcarpus 441]
MVYSQCCSNFASLEDILRTSYALRRADVFSHMYVPYTNSVSTAMISSIEPSS